MKLLLIEDDRAIGLVLTQVCKTQNWSLEHVLTGEQGLDAAAVCPYDLVLLDMGLPGIDGLTVCRQLRSTGFQNPILLLTGQDSSGAQVAGLDAGASDYVTKPFDLEVLLARIRALVRQDKAIPPIVRWQTLELQPERNQLTCQGQPVNLTLKEYGLLELLLLNPQRVYSRRAMLDLLWDFAEAPGEETVSTHIKCIRQKLKAAGSQDPIETVHGLGYRLRSPQAATPAAPEPSTSRLTVAEQKAQAVTAKIWQQFRRQYEERIHTLSDQVQTLAPYTPSCVMPEIQQIAHKLIGSLGMFGLTAAAQQARQLEQLMQATSLDPAQLDTARACVAFLQQTIAEAQLSPPPPAAPVNHPAPSTSKTAQVLIVDDDLALADRLREAAIAWNLQVEIATDLTVAQQMIEQRPPQVIVLDLNFPGEANGLSLMRELEQRSPKLPIIILTAREELRDRVAAAQLGVSAFLVKPLPAVEILHTIMTVLRRSPHSPAGDRLLLVDDDPAFLQELSTRLTDRGMQVTVSSQPENFLQTLSRCQPEALILDLEMPEFDGLELCQVVRADPQWQSLKVLFLSAHSTRDCVTKAYAAGADAYLDKAVPAPLLITQILQRLGRLET